MSFTSPFTNRYKKANIALHLFIVINISIEDGFDFYFIAAWKSGVNPSANRLIANRTRPNIYVDLVDAKLLLGSNILNIKMPIVTMAAIIIFWGPSFNYLVLTLEQQTPTKITLIKLHDLAMTIRGKLT